MPTVMEAPKTRLRKYEFSNVITGTDDLLTLPAIGPTCAYAASRAIAVGDHCVLLKAESALESITDDDRRRHEQLNLIARACEYVMSKGVKYLLISEDPA